MEKNVFSLIFLVFIFFSCKKKEEIKVSFSLDKRDSLLVVKYINTNQTNYYIDFIPELNDSQFKILTEGGSTFGFDFMPIGKNDDDSLNFKKLNCITYNKYEKELLYSYPIFLKANSTKIYKFKINNYISGRTLKIQSSKNPYRTFLRDMETSNSIKEVERLQFFRNHSCNGYTYFTGDFIFNSKQLILP